MEQALIFGTGKPPSECAFLACFWRLEGLGLGAETTRPPFMYQYGRSINCLCLNWLGYRSVLSCYGYLWESVPARGWKSYQKCYRGESLNTFRELGRSLLLGGFGEQLQNNLRELKEIIKSAGWFLRDKGSTETTPSTHPDGGPQWCLGTFYMYMYLHLFVCWDNFVDIIFCWSLLRWIRCFIACKLHIDHTNILSLQINKTAC